MKPTIMYVVVTVPKKMFHICKNAGSKPPTTRSMHTTIPSYIYPSMYPYIHLSVGNQSIQPTSIHSCIHTSKHRIDIQLYLHPFIHPCINTFICPSIHPYIPSYFHIYRYTLLIKLKIYMHKHILTHPCIHACAVTYTFIHKSSRTVTHPQFYRLASTNTKISSR